MKPTREEILSEPAGPRLDAWVAGRIFSFTILGNAPVRGDDGFDIVMLGLEDAEQKLRPVYEDYQEWRNDPYTVDDVSSGRRASLCGVPDFALAPVPKYSDDIAAAWQVVEKIMSQHTQDIYFGWCIVPPRWRFGFSKKETHCFNDHGATGDTAPLAICRAALLAVLDTGGAK